MRVIIFLFLLLSSLNTDAQDYKSIIIRNDTLSESGNDILDYNINDSHQKVMTTTKYTRLQNGTNQIEIQSQINGLLFLQITDEIGNVKIHKLIKTK